MTTDTGSSYRSSLTDAQQRARSFRFSPDHRNELIWLGDDQYALFRSGHSFELWIGALGELTPELLASLPAANRPTRPQPTTAATRAELTKNLAQELGL